MKAFVVHEDGRRGLEDLPIPSYGPYEARVKLLSCGVCNGTDMKIIHKKFKGIDDYPVVLGHEGVGEVVEVLTYPAHKLYKVKGESKTYLIPAVEDVFIRELDEEERCIYVQMMEGLEIDEG